jgi:carboxymethylenebutenolidase
MPAARDVTLRPSTDGRRLTAHLARPDAAPGEAAAPGPAVIVIHEAMGLNDDIRRIAGRFAEHGYTALAPDLVGDGFTPLCIARFFLGIGRAGTGRPYRELRAIQDWLGRQPGVDPDRIGLAGFCMGGGFALLYAIHGGRPLRAIAPFYGALPRDRSRLRELCPTVASYGGRDRVFGALGRALEEALEAAGVPHDVVTYPDAGHSFMNRHDGLLARIGPHTPMHDAYHHDAAEDAWTRVLRFFEHHLAPAA